MKRKMESESSSYYYWMQLTVLPADGQTKLARYISKTWRLRHISCTPCLRGARKAPKKHLRPPANTGQELAGDYTTTRQNQAFKETTFFMSFQSRKCQVVKSINAQ